MLQLVQALRYEPNLAEHVGVKQEYQEWDGMLSHIGLFTYPVKLNILRNNTVTKFYPRSYTVISSYLCDVIRKIKNFKVKEFSIMKLLCFLSKDDDSQENKSPEHQVELSENLKSVEPEGSYLEAFLISRAYKSEILATFLYW